MTKQYGTPGPRALYPDIARSRSLRRCSVLANALFPRLITQADDQGRGQGDPADMAHVTGALMLAGVDLPAAVGAIDELVAEGMLLTYQVDGEPYWQLLGWWEWQGPSMRRAFASRHPAPPGWADAVYGDGGDQPKTWRAALGLPPGTPGPRVPRDQSQAPVPGTDPGTVRTSQAEPGPAAAGPGLAVPSRDHARDRQPSSADAEAPPTAADGRRPGDAKAALARHGYSPPAQAARPNGHAPALDDDDALQVAITMVGAATVTGAWKPRSRQSPPRDVLVRLLASHPLPVLAASLDALVADHGGPFQDAPTVIDALWSRLEPSS